MTPKPCFCVLGIFVPFLSTSSPSFCLGLCDKGILVSMCKKKPEETWGWPLLLWCLRGSTVQIRSNRPAWPHSWEHISASSLFSMRCAWDSVCTHNLSPKEAYKTNHAHCAQHKLLRIVSKWWLRRKKITWHAMLSKPTEGHILPPVLNLLHAEVIVTA